PIEHKVRPLDSRDVIPPAQQLYETLLTYELRLPEHQQLHIGVNSMLYGPDNISLMWMLFNANTKQYMGADQT
ncbi:unnamed protein product, partial [Oppiella nova]